MLAAAAAAVAQAPAATYRVEPERTIATFAVTGLGFARATGHFGRVTGTIDVDPASASGGRIDVAIDLATVATGWGLRDDFLRGERMFDVARFPTVRFRSERLLYRDGRIVAADGELTLHGVTRPARLAVQALDCASAASGERARCAATVTGHVRRRDFGMSFAWPLVGDDVELEIAIGAVPVE